MEVFNKISRDDELRRLAREELIYRFKKQGYSEEQIREYLKTSHAEKTIQEIADAMSKC